MADRVTPVIVGAAQVVQRPSDAPLTSRRGPVELMVDAAAAALTDAGAPELASRIGWVGVAGGLFRYRDPGRLVAEALGAPGAATALTPISGTSPLELLAVAASRIAHGELEVALVVGGEARWTATRLKAAGAAPAWIDDLATSTPPPERVGGLDDDTLAELAFLGSPAAGYALLEDRLRADAGATVAAHTAAIAALWERFSAVAASNRSAWDRVAHDAASIATATADNRMISMPYTKAMVANNTVDMTSAVVVCSESVARRAGVARELMVFPLVVSHASETATFVTRRDLAAAPALQAAGRAAYSHAGIGSDDITHVDLYACFPSIVQMSAGALGFALDRELTVTGGLGFAGGAMGNAAGQSLAALVERVRAGGVGLIHANGGLATKHAVAVLAGDAYVPFDDIDAQGDVDLAPRDVIPDGWQGEVTVDAETVVHDRTGPHHTIASVLDESGRRGWRVSPTPS